MIVYDNADDAGMRYNNTFILHDDELVKVAGFFKDGGVLKCSFYDKENRAHRDDFASGKFVQKNFLVGYANFTNARNPTACYFYRTPARRMRQGLNAENVLPHKNDRRLYNASFNMLMDNQNDFENMLLGIYPSFEQAIEKLKRTPDGQVGTVAFSPKYAIMCDELGSFFLLHKGRKVASNINRESFYVPERFQYIKESLQEMGVNYHAA